jgi:hypothetical protein
MPYIVYYTVLYGIRTVYRYTGYTGIPYITTRVLYTCPSWQMLLKIMQYARKICSPFAHFSCNMFVICSKYARNIHGNLRKIHKSTLCLCVCSVHVHVIFGRCVSVFLCSNILEYGRKVSLKWSNMLEKWCNMLDLCSGRFFHRNTEYASYK